MRLLKYLLNGFIIISFAILNAQDVDNSRLMSQKTTISKTIGTTAITVEYHSPSAKGRKIFGGIVPFDFVVDGKEYAWRAGANKRTTIEFGHDVLINNKPLKAGKYGIVILVSENEWVYVFTSDFSWGAFQYKPDHDVLRVKVPVKKNKFQEWLSYNFINPKSESVDLELHWTDTSASFNISTNVSANIINDINNKNNKTAEDYRVLAIETARLNPNKIDIALNYIAEAIKRIDSLNENEKRYHSFSCNMIKADLLIKKGDIKSGEELKRKTFKTANGFDIYYYGLNKLLVKGNKNEALKILNESIKNSPKQWQNYLALGECYLHDKNQKKAVHNFKKAYEFAPDNWKNYARYLYLQNKLILQLLEKKNE